MARAGTKTRASADLVRSEQRVEQQPEASGQEHSLLRLQRMAGNRAVTGLLESRGQLRLQRKCADCSPTSKCPACEEEDERIQRKPKTTVPHLQRAPRNGNSAGEPASAAGGLIVEDDAASVSPGQMRKTEFLEQLRSAVCATADEALKEAGQSTEGCPYIEQWLGYYADQEPAHIERALRKFAPEAASATSARDYIPAVSNRVRRAVDTWARTGEMPDLPEELAGMLPGAGGMLGAVAGMIGGAVSAIGSAIGGAFSSIGKALFKRKEGPAEATDDPRAIQAQLSEGHPLDGTVGSRMGAAFGHDFSGVRVHTGAQAAGLSEQLNARAFTIGTDIAFGAGEYQPGTLIGDVLIAHELAHVVQQGGATTELSQASNGIPDESAMEADADSAAILAVSSLWSSTTARATPMIRSGLSLSRCSKKQTPVKSPADAKKAAEDAKKAGTEGEAKKKVCKPDADVKKLKAELISTFKLSSVIETGDACWTAKELTKMKGALERIPAGQRDAIAGVSLIRVEGIVGCSASGPQGCFKQNVDQTTGERHDTIQVADAAFELDKDFEDGSKSYRTDRSGKKIETLPSQDVLLHEVGHAVETAAERAAESARIVPEQEVNKTQDQIKKIVDGISRAQPPPFSVTFSTNKAEAAYQHALLDTAKKVGAMVDATGDPSNATAAEIKKIVTDFKKALPKARAGINDLKKKKAALPSGSSVIMGAIDGPLETQVLEGERLEPLLDARLAAQKQLEPAEKAEKQAQAKITFTDNGTEVNVDGTRRLAELVALVKLKRINIKKAGLEKHPTENWPEHPGELYAELYQMSISEAGGLKVFDADLAKFFESPIGPKGAWKKKVDEWIVSHTTK